MMTFDLLHLIDRFFVVSHVAAGVLALLIAPLAMATAKGGPWHRRWGKVWFWGMFWVCASTFALMFFRFSLFLLVIAVFSFYQALTGYRVLYRKNPSKDGQRPGALDWITAIVGLMFGIGLAAYGLAGVTGLIGQLGYTSNGTPFIFFVLSIMFGLALTNDALVDARSFRRAPGDKHWWWYHHMTRMLGGYTATVTAFMVQNVGRHLPDEWAWVVWVAPAFITTPLISIWVGYYKRTFDARKQQLERAVA
jgi:uncharacterized membrane protein